jgi:CubicO group peptidase (beta-lactamase class C family)
MKQMVSSTIGVAALAMWMLLTTVPICSQTPQAVFPEREIDGIFKNLTDNRSPGIAVLIRANGRTLLARGYGVRDLRTYSAIDSQANFRLASCTKQFTAMAIMLLVHDGKLRYDDRLTDIFPGFPDYGKAITIRTLLNHTSGLPDYEDLMEQRSDGKAAWSEALQIQDADVLRLLEGQKRGKFTPGTNWSYSNSGYVVLGLVVAKVSGETFGNFLHERIFAPLKMNHTLAYVRATNVDSTNVDSTNVDSTNIRSPNEVPHRAYGHSRKGKAFVETDQSATSATLGDGGVYSNLEDLAKWDDALAHHTLISSAEMQPALTPVRLADGKLPRWAGDSADANPQASQYVSYGFGWFLDLYLGHERMWHYGDTVGFKTVIERFGNGKLTIILLSNRSDIDPGALALRIATLYLATRGPTS